MPGFPHPEVVRRLRSGSTAADRPDAELLHRYAAGRDEAAFEALVRRHGPMVLGVCRRLLRCDADAEDAFQATFLVLARKAAAVRDPTAVGNWLYGVAANVARRARVRNRRRREHELAAGSLPRPTAGVGWPEEIGLVDDELARLPARYRIPIVACALEGRTIREAADDLGWAPGTVATRLARGRDLLARRLGRRGVAVPAALLAVAATAAPLPAGLVTQVVRVGVAVGVVPAAVLALTNEVTRAMLFTKLKAAAVALLAAGLAAVAVAARPGPAEQPADPQPAPAKADPPAPKPEPTAARKLIDRLRELKKGQALNDDSAAVLRDLIKLGPAAVPDVIAELDATTDPFLLRCLGFAARGIGDQRVVPALIRALPKACQTPASDYSLQVRSGDAELLAFMQAHSQRMRVGAGKFYSFGRPINEFRTALQKLTGANHGEDDLTQIMLVGSARQQYLQRDLYRQCAERWAAWWEKNAKQFVADPEYATVGLPPRPPTVAVPAAAEFPRGPRAEVRVGRMGGLLESVGAKGAKCVFWDLDTGRSAALPEKFRTAAGKPERLDDIIAWAEEEGYDLMGTEYTPPGGEPHYVIRGLGLTAWQIDTGRRQTLEAEIKADKPLEMGKQVGGGLLAPFDAAAGKYRADETGLFLFRTREGGFGWIFVGVEVRDDTQPLPLGAGGLRGDLELNPVGPAKGRRWAYTLVWDGAQEAGKADRK
jgi:RNA polymerase sigma factor (sigma-70 family)